MRSDIPEPILAPLTDAEWPPQIAALKEDFAGQLNVYRVMAYRPELLIAWERLRDHVVRGNALSLQQMEIVILRIGHRWNSEYEWSHHVIRGLKAGLSEARIAHTRNPPRPGADEDDLLIAAVDALMVTGELKPDQLAALEGAVGRDAVFDLMATIGMYSTLAFILKTFRTPVDDDIRAALADLPQLAARP